MNLKFTNKKVIIGIIILVALTLLGSYVASNKCICDFSSCGCNYAWDSVVFLQTFLFFGLPASIIIYIIISLFQKSGQLRNDFKKSESKARSSKTKSKSSKKRKRKK